MLMLDVKLQKQDYHKLFMGPDLGQLRMPSQGRVTKLN